MNTYQTPSLGQLLKMANQAQYTSGRRLIPTADTYLLVLLQAAIFVGVGYVAVPIAGTFREMLLNDVRTWTSPDSPMGISVMVPLIMVGSLLSFVISVRSGSVGIGMLLSGAAGLVGTGGGMLLNAGAYRKVQYTPGSGSFGLDIAHALPTLLPAVLLGLGVLHLLAAVASIMRKKSKLAAVNERRARGQQAEGRVIDARPTNSWVHGRPLYSVDVQYYGPYGPVRATGSLITDAMTAPALGMPVTVLYDPANPMDVQLELAPGVRPVWAPGMQPMG